MWKWVAIAVACPLCFSGCGSSSGPDITPVHGKVTLDGASLATGMVYFVPESGRGAKGKVQEDGSFTLSTFGNGDGAVVGRHKVFIVATEGEVAFESDEPMKSLVPERYTSPETSGFEIEVKVGEMNEVFLELTN